MNAQGAGIRKHDAGLLGLFDISTVKNSLHLSAAGSCQPGIIAWIDEKLASERRDSPGMSFHYLKGFSYPRTDLSRNDILHDLKI